MQFRIGINLGDVMVEGGDLFGEGVNIAARLEAIAEPGGICISGTVHDQVKNKLSLGYDYVGSRLVKNIAEEIPVDRVNTGPSSAPDDSEEDVSEELLDSIPNLAGTLGNLGERLGKLIDERLDGEVIDEKIAEKLAGRKFGELVKEHLDDAEVGGELPVVAIRSGRPGRRALGVLAILATVDALTGNGWWVQWPAIVVAVLFGLSRARGVWKLAVLAGGLGLADWALGGEWWSQWIGLGVGVLIALRYVSRIGRR